MFYGFLNAKNRLIFKFFLFLVLSTFSFNSFALSLPSTYKNLAKESMFRPLSSKQVEHIGALEYYLQCILRHYKHLENVPAKRIPAEIGSRNLKIELSFDEIENLAVNESLLEEDACVIPCKANGRRYYAYVSKEDGGTGYQITLYTEREYREALSSLKIDHGIREEAEKISHERDIDTPLSIIHDLGKDVRKLTLKDKEMQDVLEFLSAIGAETLRHEAEGFIKSGSVTHIPHHFRLNIDGVGTVSLDFLYKGKRVAEHASNRYLNITETGKEIGGALIHGLEAKCGKDCKSFNTPLEEAYLLWLSSGKTLDLSERYPDLLKAAPKLAFKDLRRVKTRDLTKRKDSLDDRENIKEISRALIPVIEKSFEEPDLDRLATWAKDRLRDLEIDPYNMVHLHNGFTVLPVKIGGKWHYLFYRNRGAEIQEIKRVFESEDAWVANEEFNGIILDEAELFVTTQKGMKNIVWEEALGREYWAVYTDIDATITPPESSPHRHTMNPKILLRFLELKKKGVPIVFTTARRERKARALEEAFLKIPGVTKDDLAGIWVYCENGGYAFDLGTGEVYIDMSLSDGAQDAIGKIRDEIEGEFKVEKVDDEYRTRVRFHFKNHKDLERAAEFMRKRVEEANETLDQRLKVLRPSGLKPVIDITREEISKTISLEHFSAITRIPKHKIAKFGDKSRSGYFDAPRAESRAVYEGGDFPITRLEGGFSAGDADPSGVFPFVSQKTADMGTLELLERIRFSGPPKSYSVYIDEDSIQDDPVRHIVRLNRRAARTRTKEPTSREDQAIRQVKKDQLDNLLDRAISAPIATWKRQQHKTRQHFVTLDSFERGISKIKTRVKHLFWANLAAGRPTILAFHGGAAVGKTETAQHILTLLMEELGTSLGRACNQDDYMVQRDRRSLVGTKLQMDIFAENMRSVRSGTACVKPMFDDYTGGNLLFGAKSDGTLVLYNGNHRIDITIESGDRFTFHEISTLHADEEDLTERSGIPHKNVREAEFVSGKTLIAIKIEDGKLRIWVRGNLHVIEKVKGDEAYKILLSDGNTKGFRYGTSAKKLVNAQDILRPVGLIAIEGTRILNEEELSGVAEGGIFVEEGVFDETVNLWGNFEVRGARYTRRAESRGRPPEEIVRDVEVFKGKQSGSELKSLPAGRRARVHIATHNLAEAIWEKFLTGELERDPSFRTELEDMGIDVDTLIGEIYDIERKRIIQVILDHVARAGKIGYPETEEGIMTTAQGEEERFASPASAYDTFQAGFLEIKVSRGKNALDEKLIRNYEILKARTNRIMDPGEIVDLREAGPIPIERGGKVEYVTLGKVLVQNHIGWLEGPCRKAVADGKIDVAKEYIDKFFDLQHLMWRRGIVDTNPDIMWRYGLLFIRDAEEVVATTSSSMLFGADALRKFDPQAYLQPHILQKIPRELRSYYRKCVRERIFIPLGYSEQKDLGKARRELYANFFENDLPSKMRTAEETIARKVRGYTGKTFPSDHREHREPLRNIDVSHPYIDSAQIDYVSHWTLLHMLDILRAEYFPLCDRSYGYPALVWTKLVLEAQDDLYGDFYVLLRTFYELLLDYPDILERVTDDRDIMAAVHSKFESFHREKRETPPMIKGYAWEVFSVFLAEARPLGMEWQKGGDYQREVAPKTPSPRELEDKARAKTRRAVHQAIDKRENKVFRVTERIPAPAVMMSGLGGVLQRSEGEGEAREPVPEAVDFAKASLEDMPLYAITTEGKSQTQSALSKAGLAEIDADHVISLEDASSRNLAIAIMGVVRREQVSPSKILIIDKNLEMINAGKLMGCITVGVVPESDNTMDRKKQADAFIDAGVDVIITGFRQSRSLMDATGHRVRSVELSKLYDVAYIGGGKTDEQVAKVLLDKKDPQRAAGELFNGQYFPDQIPGMLAAVSGIILEALEEDETLLPLVDEFYKDVIEGSHALDDEYGDQAEKVRIVAWQTLEVLSWVKGEASPRVILIDIDGVLFRSTTYKFETLARKLSERYGVKITPERLRDIEYRDAEWRHNVMCGLMTTKEFMTATNRLLREHGLKKDLNLEEFYELYFEDRVPNTKFLSYLQKLKARGYKIGVVSDRLVGDSALIRRKLAKAFPDIFEEDLIFLSSERHVTKREGLVNEAVAFASEEYNVDKAEVLGIDDNADIFRAYEPAGAKFLHYAWHDEDYPSYPELSPILKGLLIIRGLSAEMQGPAYQIVARLLSEKEVVGSASELFNGQCLPKQMPHMLVGISNILLERLIEEPSLGPLVIEFYQEVLANAKRLETQYADYARELHAIAGQASNVLSWIKRDMPGAQKMRLTDDPEHMVVSPDKHRAPSFLDKRTIPLPQAEAEGKRGVYNRGTEGVSKLGNNISEEAIHVKELFEAALNNTLMHMMIHGWLEVPTAIRETTERGEISTIHETAFITDLLPGSIQCTSTGPGHFQGTKLDVKYVTEGRGIQYNKFYNEKGELVAVYAQYIEPGSWAVALPGAVDSMEDLGGLRFNDISLEMSEDKTQEILDNLKLDLNFKATLATEADKGTIKSASKTTPYFAVIGDGKPVLVRNIKAAADPIWVTGIPAGIFGGKSKTLTAFYQGLTEEKAAKVKDEVAKAISHPGWTETQKTLDLIEPVEMPLPTGEMEIDDAIADVERTTRELAKYYADEVPEIGESQITCIVVKGLEFDASGKQDAFIGYHLKEGYRKVIRRFKGRPGGLEVVDKSQLASRVNALVGKGRRVIVLDDGNLEKGDLAGIDKGKPGNLKFCVVSALISGKAISGPERIYVNLDAMYYMGLGVLSGERELFRKGYRAFSGTEASVHNIPIEDIMNGIISIVRVLPRIIRYTDTVNDRLKIKRLFDISA